MSGISSALELRTMYARRPRKPPEDVAAVPAPATAAAAPAVGSVRSSESDLTVPGSERCAPWWRWGRALLEVGMRCWSARRELSASS